MQSFILPPSRRMYLPSPGSLSHHVSISLECSDHHLSRLSPTNCGGKSTRLSLYHAFRGWQELTIYTQLATIPPLATKSPSPPKPSSLCRNGTKSLSTFSVLQLPLTAVMCDITSSTHHCCSSLSPRLGSLSRTLPLSFTLLPCIGLQTFLPASSLQGP